MIFDVLKSDEQMVSKMKCQLWTHDYSRKTASRLTLLGAILCGLWSIVCLPALSAADDTLLSAKELSELKRIYIPEDQLENVAPQDDFRAILTFEEFEKLRQNAMKLAPDNASPKAGSYVHSYLYDLHVDGERLVGTLSIEIQSFGAAWHEARFDITGWNIATALLNDSPAPVTRDVKNLNVLRLFLNGSGKQLLKLNISTPLLAQGGDKAINVRLIGKAAGEFRITLPAGKFLETSTSKIERPSSPDKEAVYSLPIGSKRELNLTITDRKKTAQTDVLTFASTAFGINVLPSEITWIAKSELQVFGREIDRLTCLVPNTLEITDVDSNGLESWELADAPDDQTKTAITLNYRQSFEGRRGITFRGILSEKTDQPWSAPTLIYPSITSHTGSIVVQHPTHVRLQSVESTGVRAVQPVARNDASNPPAASQLNYEVWDENFSLRFVASLKERELQAAMTNVLDISHSNLMLYTTVSIESRFAPLFDFRLRLPSEWEINTLQLDGKQTEWQVVSGTDGVQELRVELNPPLSPGSTRNIALVAQSIPPTWPVESSEQSIEIPEVALPQVEILEALYGIAAESDLDIVTEEVTGLDPAGREEIELLNRKLNRATKSTRLSFTYQETEFTGKLKVQRKPTTLSAETMTIFRIDPKSLFTRLEASLSIAGGGYRELPLLISETAGEDLRFELRTGSLSSQGFVPVRIVEQIPGEVENGLRRWTLKFDRYLRGPFRLTAEVRTDKPEEGPYQPVRWSFPDSIVSSGFVAIESSPEEFVKIEAQDEHGLALAGVDPVDFPETLYKPEERIVAGYRYIHPSWTLNVATEKFERSGVPTVVGHSAELTSVVSASGEFQHQVNIRFTAVGAQSLLFVLPGNAELWSTLLDGSPAEVRRSPDGNQIPLAILGLGQHTLQLFYSTPAPDMNRLGSLQVTPPEFRVVDGSGQQQTIEMLTQDWELHLPEQTLLINSQGAFEPEDHFFQSTLFSRALELLRFPSVRTVFRRGGLIAVTAFILLAIWVTRRLGFGKDVSKLWLGGCLASCLLFVVIVAVMVPKLQRAGAPAGRAVRSYLVLDAETSMPSANEAPSSSMMYLADEVQMVPEAKSSDFDISDMELEASPELLGLEESELSRNRNSLRKKRSREQILSEPAAPPVEAPARDSKPDSMSISQKSESDDTTPFANTTDSFTPPAPTNRPNAPVQQQAQSMDGIANRRATTDEKQLGEQQTVSPAEGADQRIAGERFDGDSDKQSSFGRSLGRTPTSGLLSMTFNLQIPEGTRSQRFHYQGNGAASSAVDLQLQFANRTTGQVLLWSVALGVAILGWWLRGAGFGFRIFWLGLTILLPIALAWIVPPLWQMLLEGILCGGGLTLLFWGIHWCYDNSRNCCRCFSQKSCATGLLFVATSLLAFMSNDVFAAEPAKQPTPPPVVDQKTPYVVIPYKSLSEIDSADRVWVPQALYAKLWKAANPRLVDASDGPVKVMISEANYVGELKTVNDETQVHIQARWVVSVLTEDQVGIQLPLAGAAVLNTLVNGEQTALGVQQDGRNQIILKGLGVHIVDAQLALPARSNGSVGDFHLSTDTVGSGSFRFKLPPSDGKLHVRVDGHERLYRRIETEGETHIEFPVDQAGKRTVNWYPAAESSGQDRIVQIETAIATNVDDTGLNVNHGFQLTVRQGGLNDLTFSIPKGVGVRSLAGDDVGGWETKQVDDQQQLTVFFRREITQQTEFQIQIYQQAKIGAMASTWEVPTLTPQGVSRETVQLGVYAANHLKLRVASTRGLNQIDLSRYQPVVAPEHLPGEILYAYRTFSRPFKLELTVERRSSDAKTEVEYGVHVSRRKQLIATRIVWELAGSPRRRVDVSIPDGYLPISVVCAEASDWYVHQGESGRILTIEFPTPTEGRIEAGLEGHLTRQPDETRVELNLPQPMNVLGQTSKLGIWVDAAYQASVAQTGDWKSFPPDQLSTNYQKLDTAPAQFAFNTTKDTPENIVLTIDPAVPKFTGDGVTLIAVSDATIDYGLTLRWKISEAAADTFSFTTPNWLKNIDITGATIREIESTAIENDRTRWVVSLADPVLNQYLLTVAATIPSPTDLHVQTPIIEMEEPASDGNFSPLAIQQHYAILVNRSAGQLVPSDLTAFDSVSSDQLPLVIQTNLLQQAMEISRVRPDKIPAWTIQRMEQLEVAKAVILSAQLNTVFELDGSWRTRVTYGVRNRGKQFLAMRIPEGSRILSVYVKGEPSRTVITELNDKPVHLIALPQTSSADLSFDVQCLLAGRLAHPIKSKFAWRGHKVQLPAPTVVPQSESEDFGLPVTQTVWAVHYPDQVDASSVPGVASTNLTPHTVDAWLAIEKQTLDRLKSDVSEMVRVANDKSVSFSRRSQAKDNLKRLGSKLSSYSTEYDALAVESAESEQLRQELQGQNRFLQEEAANAITEVEKEMSLQQQMWISSGRDFIFSCNTAIVNDNGGLGITISGENATNTFNFLSEDFVDLNKSKAMNTAGKAVESRARLWTQVESQSLATSVPTIERFSDQPQFEQMFRQQFGVENQNGINLNFVGQVQLSEDLYGSGGGLGGGGGFGFGDGGMTTNDFAAIVPPTDATQGVPAGSLSIAMELPQHAKSLSFSKVGGSPELTLNISPTDNSRLLWGAMWCLVSLTLGLWVLRAFRASSRQGARRLMMLVCLAGLAGYFLLSTIDSWGGFWAFFLGGLGVILLAPSPVKSAAPAANVANQG